MKNVKKETVSDVLEEAIEKSFIYHKNRGDDFRSDKQIETAYKYGFESGAKWADEHSREVKENDLVEELDYDDYIAFFKEHPEYNNGDWGYEETWTFGQYCYKLGLKAYKG